MKGIIEYASSPEKDPFYRLISFDDGKIYAVEIMTLNNQLSDSEWVEGEACCGLFALTPDEFALKDSDTEALDTLILELLSKIPEDRLMEAYYTTLDKQKKPMKPTPGCKTMDNNKFDQYRRRTFALKIGIPFLNSADKVYMIYDKVTSDRLPAITWNGFANIFTQKEYAENIINKEIINNDILFIAL